MLLVLDIGNTNMVVGVYQKDKLLEHWRLETKKERTSDEFGIFLKELFQFSKLDLEQIQSVVISSVVPPLEFAIERMCQRYLKLKPLWVTATTKTPIKIKLDHPKELGADRIVNAVAGFKKYGGPLIIVDFGTATTFDYIDAKGNYLGGMIAPGISISNEALFEKASKLPHVEIRKPPRAIGKNTIDSMQAGIFYGYIGMVDEIVRRITQEAKVKKINVVATGGFTSLILPESKTIKKADPFLTLEGLKMIWEGQNLKSIKETQLLISNNKFMKGFLRARSEIKSKQTVSSKKLFRNK
ncbi:MAG: type III pantothenate kinase [Deltaproteobacteria bacterium]|nr:type III pantothenate kinase [Deltaproteobacteria bacterium]